MEKYGFQCFLLLWRRKNSFTSVFKIIRCWNTTAAEKASPGRGVYAPIVCQQRSSPWVTHTESLPGAGLIGHFQYQMDATVRVSHSPRSPLPNFTCDARLMETGPGPATGGGLHELGQMTFGRTQRLRLPNSTLSVCRLHTVDKPGHRDRASVSRTTNQYSLGD